jgi:hypothetical protein
MKADIEELNELLSSFEDKAIEEENKRLFKILNKRGIKIREHLLTESEAS